MIQTAPAEVYEAYYINNGTITLLGDVTDLSKTFAPQDEFIYSNLFVYEGDIYYNAIKSSNSLTWDIKCLSGRTTSTSYYVFGIHEFPYGDELMIYQPDSNGDLYLDTSKSGPWYKVCGYASGRTVGFAEKGDGLYYVRTSVSRISTLTNWTKITGYGNTSNANYYGYGINNGALYYLYANGNGVVQQGTDTTWTYITGSYENGSWHGYGINAGKLYALSGTPTQIGSATNWTKVSGTAYTSGTARSLGINDGKLYTIYGTTATQVGSSTDWKDCSGYCGSTAKGLAYNSTALYGISRDGTTTKLMDGDFVYCGENYDSDAYAVAIRRVYR